MNADGSDKRAVTKEKFRLLNQPIWSPDGRFIAARKQFTTSRSLGAGEIWLYHVSGRGGVKLVARPIGNCGHLCAAAWRPSKPCAQVPSAPARSGGIDHDIGSLEVGKLADLVVLTADPSADILNSDKIAQVMLGGRLYDAATMNEVETGEA
jgi:hypothetical protein